MIHDLFRAFSAWEQVEAIALGGSRAGTEYDENSDYDVYLYCTGEVDEAERRQLLTRFCSRIEIGNRYWECEDDCRLKSGVDIDILYRRLDDLCAEVADVVERGRARNSYTTCLWHNLKTCRILYDRDGRLAAAQKRFDVPYPPELKRNIIRRGWELLHRAMPAYETQILKAAKRGDLVSVNHRTAAFLETYFDLLLALNELTHPGEKRLIEYCQRNCRLLPQHFAQDMDALFRDMYRQGPALEDDLRAILTSLEQLLRQSGAWPEEPAGLRGDAGAI